MTEALLQSDPGSGNTLVVTFSGDWLLGSGLPSATHVLRQLQQAPRPASVSFNTSLLGEWDTGLIIALLAIHREAVKQNVEVDETGLPDGARRPNEKEPGDTQSKNDFLSEWVKAFLSFPKMAKISSHSRANWCSRSDVRERDQLFDRHDFRLRRCHAT
jgi:phospholipid/cholesterol/gamma-HCH transport system permease protein